MGDQIDNVQAFVVARDLDALAKSRARTNAIRFRELKGLVCDKGIAIGISPCDDVLKRMSRGEITRSLKDIFERKRERLRRLRPTVPPRLSVQLVGEYSPEGLRWHYHGMLFVDSMNVVDSLKRIIVRKIGRTVTEMCRNVPLYIEYMFKMWDKDERDFNDWDESDCCLFM